MSILSAVKSILKPSTDPIIVLDQLSTELMDNHPDIDRGGCCVVAAHIAPLLSQVKDIRRVRIIAANGYSKSRSLKSIRATLDDPSNAYEWYENGIDFFHIVVEFVLGHTAYVFDSTEGLTPKREFWRKMYQCARAHRNTGYFTFAEALSFANDREHWNKEFPSEQIPDVRQRITKALSALTR